MSPTTRPLPDPSAFKKTIPTNRFKGSLKSFLKLTREQRERLKWSICNCENNKKWHCCPYHNYISLKVVKT